MQKQADAAGSPARAADHPVARDPGVALVTGGTGLVGRAVIAQLRARGATAVAVSRRGGDVRGARLSLAADIGDASAFDAAVSRIENDLGRVGVLVHTAHPSAGHGTAVTELTHHELRSQLDAVADYAAVLHRLVPGMRARGGGRVVYISGALMARPAPGSGAYGAAKSAASVLTRYLALEEGRSGITANVVAPGRIVDPDNPEPVSPDMADLARSLASRMALADWPGPGDVAAAVLTLLDSPAITGQTLWITGGEPIA